MYGVDHCQNLNSKGGESEQDIPRVVRGITRRGESHQRDCYVEWDQHKRKNLPGLSAPPPQSFSQMLSLERVGGTRLFSLCPCDRRRRNPTRGFPSRHLGSCSWWLQWLTPDGGYSLNGLPCWPLASDVSCLRAVTYRDREITALAVRARLEPKGWSIFSWGFNLLWNDWPFAPVTPFIVPGHLRS